MARPNATSVSEIAEQAQRMEGDLSAIRRVMRQPLESQFERGDLTPPQTAVMRVVVRHQGISLKALSRDVSLSHSTVSGIIDRLEKRGLIQRRPDPGDGRFVRIRATARVRRFIRHEMTALVCGPLQNALLAASPEERTKLESAVRRLRELLEAQ
jgi:DNA-binding MarR family transcriptional regulator